MSDSMRPHRWQPTRLPRPWDSPGKNTGVGCHFLLQCTRVKSESEVTQSCLTLSNPMDCSLPGSSVHGIFQARVLERSAIALSNSVYTQALFRALDNELHRPRALACFSARRGKLIHSPICYICYIQSQLSNSVRFSSVQSFSHFQLFATP